MTFSPEEFHRVAADLQGLKVPTGEGRYRTISGRAYYSAYLATCRALCRTHGFSANSFFPHQLVSDTLASYQSDADVKTVGTLLHGLRLSRIHADYRLGDELEEDTSDDSVDDAKTLLEVLRRAEPKLPRIEPTG